MLNNRKEIGLFVLTISALSLFVFLSFNRHSKTVTTVAGRAGSFFTGYGMPLP
ncbi:MAG: hypothetical protein IPJ83_05170 [Saprospiraceae bacterium]|nr:hypothetical protein [Candidatus Vicinibacter proximus]